MILYIDTSTSLFISALVKNNKIIASINEELDKKMSEVALLKITSLFTDNNIKPTEIKKIVVINGPGSFTGIRVGITIAKTFAWATNIPIIEASGLESMAISTDKDAFLVPVIDAKRDYVFAAIYHSDKKEYISPHHIGKKELENHLSALNEYVIITNDDVNIIGNKVSYEPNILNIINAFKDQKPTDVHMVNPNYLKLTEAEENKA